jgi:hypothetical protein
MSDLLNEYLQAMTDKTLFSALSDGSGIFTGKMKKRIRQILQNRGYASSQIRTATVLGNSVRRLDDHAAWENFLKEFPDGRYDSYESATLAAAEQNRLAVMAPTPEISWSAEAMDLRRKRIEAASKEFDRINKRRFVRLHGYCDASDLALSGEEKLCEDVWPIEVRCPLTRVTSLLGADFNFQRYGVEEQKSFYYLQGRQPEIHSYKCPWCHLEVIFASYPPGTLPETVLREEKARFLHRRRFWGMSLLVLLMLMAPAILAVIAHSWAWPLAWIALVILSGLVAAGVYDFFAVHSILRHWSNHVDSLKSKPSIVLVGGRDRAGGHVINVTAHVFGLDTNGLFDG